MSKETIVITGASTGIGRAVLIHLFEKFPNARFITANRKTIPKEELPCDITLIQFPIDLGVWDKLSAWCRWLDIQTIDILVNNAGTMPFAKIGSVGVEEYNKTLDVNLRAPFFLSQACIRHMPGGGRIINVASIAGGPWVDPDSSIIPYSISKAGLIMLTRQLAKAFPTLRINSVSPGLVGGTNIVGGEPIPQSLIDTVPIKREVTTQEVARLIGFLCSKDADYITGQDIVIDGGKTLWG